MPLTPQPYRLTPVASSDGRFLGFDPYVPSISDTGSVAFQATLPGGHSGVFIAEGQSVTDVAVTASAACPVQRFTSHPDINRAGAIAIYGVLSDGHEALLTFSGNGLAATGRQHGFADVGPLGPTMNERGDVAFRAALPDGRAGIHLLRRAGECTTVAVSGQAFRSFEGLPVVNDQGQLVFRAELPDGQQGVFSDQDGHRTALALTGEAWAELARFPALNDRGLVAFTAVSTSSGPGVFAVTADGVECLVGAASGFESFRGVLINNAGPVVFYGTPHGGQLGIYAGPDAGRHRVLGLGDPLFGGTVADFALNPVSVNEQGQLAIRVALGDGRQFILRGDPA